MKAFILFALIIVIDGSQAVDPPECIIVTVPPCTRECNSVTKTIEKGYKCPALVDKTNCKHPSCSLQTDTYSVTQAGNQITVRRTDPGAPYIKGLWNGGWGGNVKFECCKDEDSCLWKKDGFASDHKTYEGFTTKYGENWLEIHDWKWCDKTCEELAALNYCELAWKDVLHCSAIDNLKVQDTCKRSCDKKCQ